MAIVAEDLEAYAAAHTTDLHPLYGELREVTHAQTELPQMQVGKLEGRLLYLLAKLIGAERAVEIGTFTGYSALSIAEGLVEGGVLYACDIDAETLAIAQGFWDRAPWGDRIEGRLGPGLETLQELEGPFDLAFIDADKVNYANYWDALVPKMRPGGLIAVDNTLWYGQVLDPQKASDRAIAAFNRHAQADDRVENVLLTVRDGIMLGRVR